MMKNAFYFISKALFVPTKQLDEKDEVNLKFYDVIVRLTNNCNTYIA